MLISKLFKSFLQGTSGSMAVWAAISTPVLVGGAALSVDASRIYNMDNDLQAASDALARSGAAELDQRGDSLQRASRAMTRLVTNNQKFGKGGHGNVQIDTIRYLKSIPSNDYDTIATSDVTYNPAEAKFVEVKVKPQDVQTFFPTSLLRKITDVTLTAKSVAGFEQGVCGVAPIFMCNPFEGTSKTIYEAMEDTVFRRRQIKFKSPDSKSKYGPGNFGWLDPFGGRGGASAIRDAVAIDIPPICMSKSAGVVLRPGNISSVQHGINTRFDMYSGPFKSKKNDPRYAPAANVVKGMAGKACKETSDSSTMALPRDKCFLDTKNNSNSCVDYDNRIGKGDWDFVEYMKINHNYMRNITIEGVAYTIDYNLKKFTPSAPPSRYAMYRWEIDNNCVPGDTSCGNSKTPEEGLPQCHTYGPSTTVEDRRIIHAAVLNCGAIQASGENMNGRTDPLPVETFVKVFLTEPMGTGKENIIYGEIVGPVVQGQDSVARDQVALAR